VSEFDAIFVGAGHNSWHAPRIWRSRVGKTGIFERSATIGGAVQTGEFTLPGFRHDFGAMNLSLFAGSAFHKKYANELKTHGLEFTPVVDCFASAFPDDRWCGVSNDLEKTASRMAAFSQADAATWRRLVAVEPEDSGQMTGQARARGSDRRHATATSGESFRYETLSLK
jgi:phytoene dehydrogenase-like protein